jgi:hypothetical protein
VVMKMSAKQLLKNVKTVHLTSKHTVLNVVIQHGTNLV